MARSREPGHREGSVPVAQSRKPGHRVRRGPVAQERRSRSERSRGTLEREPSQGKVPFPEPISYVPMYLFNTVQ